VATWGDAKLVKRQRVSSRGGVLSSVADILQQGQGNLLVGEVR